MQISLVSSPMLLFDFVAAQNFMMHNKLLILFKKGLPES